MQKFPWSSLGDKLRRQTNQGRRCIFSAGNGRTHSGGAPVSQSNLLPSVLRACVLVTRTYKMDSTFVFPAADSLIFHPFCAPSLFLSLTIVTTDLLLPSENKWGWPSCRGHETDLLQRVWQRFWILSPLCGLFPFPSLCPLSPSFVSVAWAHFSSFSRLISCLVHTMAATKRLLLLTYCTSSPFPLFPCSTFVIVHPVWLSALATSLCPHFAFRLRTLAEQSEDKDQQ